MCELFAFSSRAPTSAQLALAEFRQHGCVKGPHCDGWGVAFYKGKYAQIYREDKPAAYSELMAFLIDHGIDSNCVICHIRKATQGNISLQNTQPFSRECHGIPHLFAHNGNLKDFKENCVFDRYQPIGDTDSEFAFCNLMDNVYLLWRGAIPTLEQRVTLLSGIFSGWAALGPANIIYSDGEYLFAFANRRTQLCGNIEPPGLYYLQCDGESKRPSIKQNGSIAEITCFASIPLSGKPWHPFKKNELIVCKNGRILMKVQL